MMEQLSPLSPILVFTDPNADPVKATFLKLAKKPCRCGGPAYKVRLASDGEEYFCCESAVMYPH